MGGYLLHFLFADIANQLRKVYIFLVSSLLSLARVDEQYASMIGI